MNDIFFPGHVEHHEMFVVRARTLHVHQCADISASHRVGHLAGHRVCEIGVVHCHLQTVSFGIGDGDATFRPPVGAIKGIIFR